MREHLLNRIANLRANLPGENMLVTGMENIRYLTGFTGSSATLLISASDLMLISDGRYEEQLAQQCPGLDVYIFPMGQKMNQAVTETMRARFSGEFFFESGTMSYSRWLETSQSYDGDFVGCNNVVEDLRAIKDSVEVDLIRKSVEINQIVFEEVCQWIGPETTERDVAAEIEYRGRQRGADGCSFEPIVAVGPNSALAHYRPSDVKLSKSEFTLIDWGLSYQGYASDLCRIYSQGPVPKRYQEIYNITLAAQEAAIAAVKPGIELRALDQVARQVIQDAGFGAQFSHSLGHGIGLEIHESPGVSPRSQGVVKKGMVLTIEPGIYLAGFGGVRIEDDVWVTAEGCELISDLPKQLD